MLRSQIRNISRSGGGDVGSPPFFLPFSLSLSLNKLAQYQVSSHAFFFSLDKVFACNR
jgi:hypothetical protein